VSFAAVARPNAAAPSIVPAANERVLVVSNVQGASQTWSTCRFTNSLVLKCARELDTMPSRTGRLSELNALCSEQPAGAVLAVGNFGLYGTAFCSYFRALARCRSPDVTA